MKKYKDRLWKHIHESAKFFHEIGVMSEERLRECEEACTVHQTRRALSGGAARMVSSPAAVYTGGADTFNTQPASNA